MLTTRDAIRTISFEHPDWIPIVRSCLRLARRTGETGFAGRWVLNDLRNEGRWAGLVREGTKQLWFPGLTMLVRYGILQHRLTTRAGRRAYYTMVDPDGVESALSELGLAT
jgi:hypothetical protein